MIQLIAIGYVIQAIFDVDSLWPVAALIAVMVVFGAYTARARAARCRRPGAAQRALDRGFITLARPGAGHLRTGRPSTSCRWAAW